MMSQGKVGGGGKEYGTDKYSKGYCGKFWQVSGTDGKHQTAAGPAEKSLYSDM